MRKAEFRVGSFECLKFSKQAIILGVRNFRMIEDVIAVVVMQDFFRQLRDSGFDGGAAHLGEVLPSPTTRSEPKKRHQGGAKKGLSCGVPISVNFRSLEWNHERGHQVEALMRNGAAIGIASAEALKFKPHFENQARSQLIRAGDIEFRHRRALRLGR